MATIKHSKRWYFWAKIICKGAGIACAFLPALISTLFMFPNIVVTETKSTISGVAVLAGLFALIPLISVFLKAIKTPSTSLVTVIILILLASVFTALYYAQESTRYGLMIVSLVAAISNVIAAVLFKVASMMDDLFKHCGEVYVNER